MGALRGRRRSGFAVRSWANPPGRYRACGLHSCTPVKSGVVLAVIQGGQGGTLQDNSSRCGEWYTAGGRAVWSSSVVLCRVAHECVEDNRGERSCG